MLLNGLTESLHNVVQGDTLLKPAHFQVEHDANSGLKKFDYIVSNPPFKVDSQAQETKSRINGRYKSASLREYQLFQTKRKNQWQLLVIHPTRYSFVKIKRKAALVVPTGFITAQSGIEKKIREHMIENKLLKGVYSNAIKYLRKYRNKCLNYLLDKANTDGKVLLMDASKMGKR